MQKDMGWQRGAGWQQDVEWQWGGSRVAVGHRVAARCGVAAGLVSLRGHRVLLRLLLGEQRRAASLWKLSARPPAWGQGSPQPVEWEQGLG